MRQAIVTKYLCPTNHKCARIKAYADAGAVTISWDHALNVEDNHYAAAKSLADKYGWLDAPYNQYLVGGGMPQNSDYAFCYVMVPIEAPPKTKAATKKKSRK